MGGSESGTPDQSLAHFGVKGMRWGVRRTREQLDSDSEDAVNAKIAKGKIAANRTTDVLSNQELQHVVNRMNLEQQYSKLTGKSPQKSEGRKFAEKMVKGEVNALVSGNKGPVVKTVGKLIELKAANTYQPKHKK